MIKSKSVMIVAGLALVATVATANFVGFSGETERDFENAGADNKIRSSNDRQLFKNPLPFEEPARSIEETSAEDEQPAIISPFAEQLLGFTPTRKQKNELLQWSRKRGYLIGSTDYDTYSIETLESLASHGDMLAMQMAGEHYSAKRDFAKAMDYYVKAAVRNSVKAVEGLAEIEIEMIESAPPGKGSETKK